MVAKRLTHCCKWQDPDFRLRDYDLFLIDADGGDPVRLTDDPGDPRFASWSPDGSMIAFSAKRDGLFQVFVINVDGSGLKQLTHHSRNAFMPAWSPDGSKIAYTARVAFSAGSGLDSAIYVMDADGSNQLQVTKVDTFSPTLAPAS